MLRLVRIDYFKSIIINCYVMCLSATGAVFVILACVFKSVVNGV